MNYNDINFGDDDKVSAGVFKFENVGDAVKGTCVGKRLANTRYGENMVYEIDTTEGVKAVFGSAMLDDQMKFVSVGQIVEIKLMGEKNTGKGNPLKILQVFSRKGLVNEEWLKERQESEAREDVMNNGQNSQGQVQEDGTITDDINVDDLFPDNANENNSDPSVTQPTTAPPATRPALNTVEEKKAYIVELAKTKLNVVNDVDIPAKVMEKTSVAYIDGNLDQIIDSMEKA